MYKVCLVGPFPPPINGNSKALETLIKSEEFNDTFVYHKINMNHTAVGQSGRFSFEKVKTIIMAITQIRRLKKEKIDCFYITTSQSRFGLVRDLLLILVINRTYPYAKIVAHLHGGGFKKMYDNSSSFMRRVAKATYSRIDKVIVLSESLVGMFEDIYPVDRIAIRYNCVDDEFLFDENDIIESKNKENIIVTYLSNMIKSKGYDYLLQAAKKFHDINTKIHFYFAGSFPDKESEIEFIEKINNWNIKDTVHYLGVVSGKKKKELLINTDIFVLPTRYPYEGQPISIIEAMGAGAVIITTDQGGIPDIVLNDENGFIMKDVSSDEIVTLIIQILSNIGIKNQIMRNNIMYVRQKFTEHNYVQGIINEIISLFQV